MRIAPLIAVVCIAILCLAEPASASPKFKSTYKLKLTTKKPKSSAGWTADVKLRDPGDPQKRPKILTGLKLTFPRGSKFDARAHAGCSVANAQFEDAGPETLCPAATKFGSGQAKVILANTPLSFPINGFNVFPQDFNKKRPELLLSVVLDPNNPDLSFLIEGLISGPSMSFSLELAPQYDIHVTDIHIKIPASRLGKRTYLRTPAKCPKTKHWKAKVHATYDGGSKETRRISVPCKR